MGYCVMKTIGKTITCNSYATCYNIVWKRRHLTCHSLNMSKIITNYWTKCNNSIWTMYSNKINTGTCSIHFNTVWNRRTTQRKPSFSNWSNEQRSFRYWFQFKQSFWFVSSLLLFLLFLSTLFVSVIVVVVVASTSLLLILLLLLLLAFKCGPQPSIMSFIFFSLYH